jgi:hypothetical protein
MPRSAGAGAAAACSSATACSSSSRILCPPHPRSPPHALPHAPTSPAQYCGLLPRPSPLATRRQLRRLTEQQRHLRDSVEAQTLAASELLSRLEVTEGAAGRLMLEHQRDVSLLLGQLREHAPADAAAAAEARLSAPLAELMQRTSLPPSLGGRAAPAPAAATPLEWISSVTSKTAEGVRTIIRAASPARSRGGGAATSGGGTSGPAHRTRDASPSLAPGRRRPSGAQPLR